MTYSENQNFERDVVLSTWLKYKCFHTQGQPAPPLPRSRCSLRRWRTPAPCGRAPPRRSGAGWLFESNLHQWLESNCTFNKLKHERFQRWGQPAPPYHKAELLLALMLLLLLLLLRLLMLLLLLGGVTSGGGEGTPGAPRAARLLALALARLKHQPGGGARGPAAAADEGQTGGEDVCSPRSSIRHTYRDPSYRFLRCYTFHVMTAWREHST